MKAQRASRPAGVARRRRPRSSRRSARAARRSAPAGSTCRSRRGRPGRARRAAPTSRSSRVDRPQVAVGVARRLSATAGATPRRRILVPLAGILPHSALPTKKVRKVDKHPARNPGNHGPGNSPLRLRHRSDGRHDRHGRRHPDDPAADPDLRDQAGDRDRHRHLLRGGDQDRRRLAPPEDGHGQHGPGASGWRPAASRPRWPASGRSRSLQSKVGEERLDSNSSTRCSAAPC